MAAATGRVPRNTRTHIQAIPTAWKFPVASGVSPYEGWLMAYRLTDGFMVPFTEAAGLGSAGIAIQDQQAGTADGQREMICDGQVVDLDQSTAPSDSFTNANIPAVAYGVDNHTIGKLSTGRSIAGVFFGLNPATGKARTFVGPAAYALASAMAQAAAAVPAAGLQTGTGTLVAGVLTVSTGITVTAGGRVIVTRKTPGGTFAPGGYDAPSADRVVGGPGIGTIVIRARKVDGTAETADTSTVDYIIVG